jgi:predicted ATP-dependent serine protease
MDQRLKEATKLGFTRAIVPAACAPDRQHQEISLMPLSQLSELVSWFGLPERD